MPRTRKVFKNLIRVEIFCAAAIALWLVRELQRPSFEPESEREKTGQGSPLEI